MPRLNATHGDWSSKPVADAVATRSLRLKSLWPEAEAGSEALTWNVEQETFPRQLLSRGWGRVSDVDPGQGMPGARRLAGLGPGNSRPTASKIFPASGALKRSGSRLVLPEVKAQALDVAQAKGFPVTCWTLSVLQFPGQPVAVSWALNCHGPAINSTSLTCPGLEDLHERSLARGRAAVRCRPLGRHPTSGRRATNPLTSLFSTVLVASASASAGSTGARLSVPGLLFK